MGDRTANRDHPGMGRALVVRAGRADVEAGGRRAAAASSLGAGGARGDAALAATWWTLFLAGAVLRFVGFFVLLGTAFARLEYGAAATLRASDVAPGLWVSAAGAVVFALAAWPAIAIVRRVDARQITRGGDLVGAAGSHAPPPRPDIR